MLYVVAVVSEGAVCAVEATVGCRDGTVQTDGSSPLSIASWSGHVDVVRALVEAGAAVDQADVSRSVGLCVPGSRTGAARGAL